MIIQTVTSSTESTPSTSNSNMPQWDQNKETLLIKTLADIKSEWHAMTKPKTHRHKNPGCLASKRDSNQRTETTRTLYD